jgi:signal peptide peptidase SppA
MTDLPHLASRLYGTPLLVARPKLDVIMGALGPRLAGQALAPLDIGAMPGRELEVTQEGIAIIPITGTLVARSGYLAAASGLTSYSEIGDAIETAATDPQVCGILLDIDSSGGEVGGLFDLVERITAIRQASGKPIQALANEAALSAAYAIACAADSITVTQTAEIGSIGVVAIHVDESAADARAGLAWSFVHAGERKVDGNSHEPLSSRARADIQADVDFLYERFVALVARRRNLSPEAVRTTEAGVYRGHLAVKAGLADQVGTIRNLVSRMANELPRPISKRGQFAQHSHAAKEISMQTDPEHLPIPKDEKLLPESEEALAAPTPEPTPPVSPTPASAAGIEQRLRSQFAELAAISTQAARLGIKIDASEAMAKGLKPDALRQSVLDQLAARSEASEIFTAAPPLASSVQAESPIVKRAREAQGRAGAR